MLDIIEKAGINLKLFRLALLPPPPSLSSKSGKDNVQKAAGSGLPQWVVKHLLCWAAGKTNCPIGYCLIILEIRGQANITALGRLVLSVFLSIRLLYHMLFG